jgi:redox-sensitive bicupin YhaK (pirin superfamily)
MITIRTSAERGHFDHGWLNTYHTFSFSRYYDPNHLAFRSLRVVNEDRVQPQTGFGEHPHRDMEIITYVLEGELTHQDSLGHGSVIRPGEVQRMTAGKGIRHSEMNHSQTTAVHFLQIWIFPDREGLQPEYEQKPFPENERLDRLCLLASPDGREGSLTIHQDVSLSGAILNPETTFEYPIKSGRHGWLQVARGQIDLNGRMLGAGDGAAISEEAMLKVAALKKSELLLFDLA